MSPIEIKFFERGSEENFIVTPQSSSSIRRRCGLPLTVFCDESDDIGWIELNRGDGEIEVWRLGSKKPNKISSPWTGFKRGDQVRITDGNELIAVISHQTSSPEKTLTPKVRSSFIERRFPFMRRR